MKATRVQSLGIVLSLVAVISLAFPMPARASGEWDVLTLYYAGCPRETPAVGWHHQGCWSGGSSGQQSGQWKEIQYMHCWTAEEYYEYFEYRNGSWVQVTQQYFWDGQCAC